MALICILGQPDWFRNLTFKEIVLFIQIPLGLHTHRLRGRSAKILKKSRTFIHDIADPYENNKQGLTLGCRSA
jgi:hypothetical protein